MSSNEERKKKLEEKKKALPKIPQNYVAIVAIVSLTSLGLLWGYLGWVTNLTQIGFYIGAITSLGLGDVYRMRKAEKEIISKSGSGEK